MVSKSKAVGIPRILAIIPARGGSKGLPGKNIVTLGGKPLIAYSIEAVLGARHMFDHIVSTDSKEVAEVAWAHGGNVPWLRPARLARDSTSIADVGEYILERAEKEYDYVMLLQPTAPLRTSQDIDAVIDLAIDKKAECVCSFTRLQGAHPYYFYYLDELRHAHPLIDDGGSYQRQMFPEVLIRNGAVYLIKVDLFLSARAFYGPTSIPYIMPAERSVNVDTAQDLALAEKYYSKQSV